MKYLRYTIILLLLIISAGCSSKFQSMLTESWSENYALASNGAKASHPEINDGDMANWGIARPPDRVYTISFPEEKKVNRIVVYSRNVIAYQLFGWDKEADKWKLLDVVDITKGRQQVNSDRQQLEVPRFDHRMNFKTDKIRLQVNRTESDGFATTRTPGKDDKVLNHRIEYIGTGRQRIRVDLYDVFVQGPAAIREIEAYSHLEKPKVQ